MILIISHKMLILMIIYNLERRKPHHSLEIQHLCQLNLRMELIN